MRTYSNDDIIDLYTGAKDKVEEIKILTELTQSDEATIIQILMDAGVYKGQYKKCIKCGKKFIGVHRQGKTNQCPECRQITTDIAASRKKLMNNMKKIKKLNEENIVLATKIALLRDKKK